MDDAQTEMLKNIIANRIYVAVRQEKPPHNPDGYSQELAEDIYNDVYDYLTTPYFDEEHQGGNLIDALMGLVTENKKLNDEITRLQEGITRIMNFAAEG